MAADESLFMRTVLPLNTLLKSHDSSLALPSEDKLTQSEFQVKHRRNRVEEQVQLTLSRKGKRSTLRGSLSSSQLPTTTPVRYASTKPFSTYDYYVSSVPSRPVERVDVSHRLEFPQANGGYGTFSYGLHRKGLCWGPTARTLPMMRSVSSTNRLNMALPHLHSAYTESFTKPSASDRCTTLQLPGRTIYREDSLDDVFLPDNSYAPPLGAGHQKLVLEKQKLLRSLSHPPEEVLDSLNLSWLVLNRTEKQGMASRQPSQPASLGSADGSVNTAAAAREHDVTQGSMVHFLQSRNRGTEMTLKKAVNLLSHENTEMQITAVDYIQTQCFSSAEAKKMLFRLRGIPNLLRLLGSDSDELQQATAGALRNAVFESSENKMEVKDCQGFGVILRLLQKNQDTETRRQLTGLLWNLSSHDMLKEQLCTEVVKPLTDTVLVPCSGVCEGEDPKLEMLADPDVFLNATGCLRNVSSAGPNGRKALRDCDHLIDSLVYYIRGTIADYKPDDKALENCVCILHNLTYQYESEIPEMLMPALREPRQSLAIEPQTHGCFSVKSPKITEAQSHSESDCPLLENNGNPRGVEWLWSAITIRMYLSLVAVSNRRLTQEAAIGAMQNLTAGNKGVSQAMAHIIVTREGGLQQVKKVLHEGEEGVRRASVYLVKNLSRNKDLHPDIIKQVLPELVPILPASDLKSEPAAEVTSVCHILNNLSQASVQSARAILNHGVLPRVIGLSAGHHRYGPTSCCQAASVLLHTLWRHSELHSSYRKAGYRKTDFINTRTMKAVSSTRD
ncbi:plakophilin-2 [Electrophorus electricus]|uniref:Plakophilin 2 n=1 Tax=Electrophorus electricus TaxID=8005 RepID=A0A4W4HE72_ELEEL|nr:plakophilin-2 [Electrophorus electricus]